MSARRPVLLVEDNATTRKLVRVLLELRGHVVVEAPDARSALAQMANHQPAVIIQDLVLPDADGFALIVELRARARAPMRVLAFSGLISRGDERRLLAAGFDDVLAKPVEPTHLATIVESHLAALLEPLAEHPGTGRRALLADDDPLQLKLVRFHLERLGFAVEAFPDGQAVLEHALTAPPDLIVADVLMPRLDGFGLVLAARRSPVLADVPLVLVTSNFVDPSDRALARRSGASDLVQRSPELRELSEAIQVATAGPAPREPGDSTEALERARGDRLLHQLERQLELGSRLSRRCSSLAAELTVLTGISEALLRHHHVDAALDEALAACLDAAAVSRGALYLIDGSGALTARALGVRPAPLADELRTFYGHDSLLRRIIAGGELAVLPGATPDPDVDDVLRRADAPAALVVPLRHQERALGALFMVTGNRELDDDLRIFGQGVGNQLALALTLAELFNAQEASAREIVEQRAQLQVTDRLAAVGALAAGIGHEINNPLAVVVTNLELAATAAGRHGDPELSDALRDARGAAQRVRDVVRDLKVFSRAEETTRGPVDVAHVIETALRVAANEIRHRARLVTHFEPVPAVDASEARLGQVFLNLIVNAAHAIPEGRAEHNELRVTARRTDAGVLVEVTDTGTGMPDDVVARLFTPFFTTKPIGVGSGLGLSICHRIIGDLGGRIEVTTKLGAGSTFGVHLPPSKLAASDTEELTTAELPASPPRRGAVLVVDDEPMIGRALRRMLVALHDVTVVDRAADALARYDAGERWDVILCDLMMPQMTGMDLHAELTRRDPAIAERMIFLTGGAFTAGARQFLDRIPNPHLDKPFDGPSVQALVARALDDRAG